MPSKRPQTIRGPGPAASSVTRDWCNGRPRGPISSRGRSGAMPAASIAAARMSARSTMPGPPPAGVSSTLRCLSVAELRISRASSSHRPDVSALPARLTPSGPGNISGNSVRMVARQVIALCLCKRGLFALDFLRQFDHDAAAGDVDSRHHGICERQQHGRALWRCDLYDVAGAEIMDGDDAADRLVCGIHRGEPDQVGVVVLVAISGRQFLTRHVELDAVEFL